MSWSRRIKIQTKSLCRQLLVLCRVSRHTGEGTSIRTENNGSNLPQYRVEATSTEIWRGLRGRVWAYCGGSAFQYTRRTRSVHHSRRLAGCLHWMFRVNFLFVLAVMCIMFFLLVVIFTGLLVAAGRHDHQCIRVGGAPFASTGADFADAFALSWTTFATVGYGSTYPALGHENDSPSDCAFVTLLCSMESFVGVLYSGFCGAILFGKVLRIQSQAQVIFSDPIVIRYGTGVHGHDEFHGDDGSAGDVPKRIPCPVLEFRVVNRLFAEVGGEIMDATLNVVANVDTEDEEAHVTESLGSGIRQRERKNSKFSSTLGDSGSESHSESGRISSSSIARSAGSKNFAKRAFPSFLHRFDSHVGDDDLSAPLVNKRIFCKMLLEANEHPFFKRVWLARHVLDETSPILLPKVRRQIRRCQGHWPESLNTHEGVRNSLQFNQILVSLNGISNVSAADVYAQKIYDFVDINVGYQFVNVLYKDKDGTLMVDTSVINDVQEQDGGGGEPLFFVE